MQCLPQDFIGYYWSISWFVHICTAEIQLHLCISNPSGHNTTLKQQILKGYPEDVKYNYEIVGISTIFFHCVIHLPCLNQ